MCTVKHETWALARHNLRKTEGLHSGGGIPVYHSRKRNKLILTVIPSNSNSTNTNSLSNSPPGQTWSSHQHKVVFDVRSANYFITEHPIESSLMGDETPTVHHKLSRHWSSIYRDLDKETKLCHTVFHATVKGMLYVFKLSEDFYMKCGNLYFHAGPMPPQQNVKYYKAGRTGKLLNGKILSVERIVSYSWQGAVSWQKKPRRNIIFYSQAHFLVWMQLGCSRRLVKVLEAKQGSLRISKRASWLSPLPDLCHFFNTLIFCSPCCELGKCSWVCCCFIAVLYTCWNVISWRCFGQGIASEIKKLEGK